ncbi:hypothetical protein [Puia dinghuensis]|uniref:Uncharacterized protein n=1 Tax=Puia dinghuensis TaxID=1792502 RepID=A0A8J2UE10_9BACT|nr:hypothetical protein [Puia dinghuensis]GGB05031.1 hypothetical protein GCM10011511_30420 [Puia dinghuensis]
MKKHLYSLLLLISPYLNYAQPKVTWGDEFKLKQGSTDLSIIKADASGVYLEEFHMVNYRTLWEWKQRKSSTLVKLDPSLGEVYRKGYDHELKGKEPKTFFFIRDKLYLFAVGYEKNEKEMNLYAAELDKTSGNLKTDWQQLSSWDVSAKHSLLALRITPNTDTSKIVITSTDFAGADDSYDILTLDADLHPLGKPFHIANEFRHDLFDVEDLIYTSVGNVVVVGRVYGEASQRRRYFRQYSIRLYDSTGKMKKDVQTDIPGRFLANSQVVQLNNEIVVAAFFTNDRSKMEINGLMVQRLDAATGNLITSTKKDFTVGLVSQVENDDDKDSQSVKTNKDTVRSIGSHLVFRNFFVAPDNGLVFLAEQFATWTSSYTYSYNVRGSFSTSTSSSQMFLSGDIYIGKLSPGGEIEYLEILPKRQFEEMAGTLGLGSGMLLSHGFFDRTFSRPFFSGFGCLRENNMLDIFFNDDDRNADVVQPGKKVIQLSHFHRSTCFEVQLDMITGKLTRKALFSNKDIPPAMPRLGVVSNNTLFLTGMNDPHFAFKSKLAVGKINTL